MVGRTLISWVLQGLIILEAITTSCFADPSAQVSEPALQLWKLWPFP
jgi:hypothetical protein